MNYDVIGDIHGHADQLRALLRKLGYRETMGAWRHPERMALFVGDFIDRGPKQMETVAIARRMIDGGSALSVMGNHEFNAIAWFLPDPNTPGDFLRSHFSPKNGNKNTQQHAAFLAEVQRKPKLHEEVIEWFLTLPLWLDLPELRVIHACWHQRFIDYLRPMLQADNKINRDMMPLATQAPTDGNEAEYSPTPSVFKSIDTIIKGTEIPLPTGHSFQDKDGTNRINTRIRWWDTEATTYRSLAMLNLDDAKRLPDLLVPKHECVAYTSAKPLFVGHYWLNGSPTPLSDKIACVDYSMGKGEKLCAYCWNGETTLSNSAFQWVP